MVVRNESELMRFVQTSKLKPGLITGEDLYGLNNELMLRENQVLTDVIIHRINMLNVPGIYIKDELSLNIDVKHAINSGLKNSALKTIKGLFSKPDSHESKTVGYKKLISIVDDIVNEISSNDIAALNLTDLKMFDDYTYYHSVNVAVLSIIIGISMGLNRNELYNLGIGAILHDIGKIFINKEILDKKEKLTDEEYAIIREHSKKGSDFLKTEYNIPVASNLAVLTHHERYNGRGYPYSLKKDKIPELGSIITVADVYDALTSDRPYRKAVQPSEAVEYIIGGCGTLFDPDVVRAFSKQVVPYPVGTFIELSDGKLGIVSKIYTECCIRPLVKIVNSDSNEPLYYDLYNDNSLLNVTILGVADI